MNNHSSNVGWEWEGILGYPRDSDSRGMEVNKTRELSLKCDCTLQWNSSDVRDVVALLDCWIFNSVRSVQALFRASRCVSCEFWCQWMERVGVRLIQLFCVPRPQPKYPERCGCVPAKGRDGMLCIKSMCAYHLRRYAVVPVKHTLQETRQTLCNTLNTFT